MEYLVTYDVATSRPGGEARLRKVASICQAFGQRVQKSVFECTVTESDLEVLRFRLLKVIDEKADSLRFYRLREPHKRFVEVYGIEPAFDLRGPIVL